jgi:hypothetical protein
MGQALSVLHTFALTATTLLYISATGEVQFAATVQKPFTERKHFKQAGLARISTVQTVHTARSKSKRARRLH